MGNLIILFIKFYQRIISPFLERFSLTNGKACRYNPTCSVYTIQAVEKYGTIKGLILGFKRFLSCNQLSHRQHYDPVV